MPLEITTLSVDDLSPEDIATLGYSEGKKPRDDGQDYLKVVYNGEVIAFECDRMEPEDARFIRDLGWIEPLLHKVHMLGMLRADE